MWGIFLWGYSHSRKLEETMSCSSPSLSSTIAQIVFFPSLIIGFHFLLPLLQNATKKHDFSPIYISPKKSFFPLAHCPQSSTCCIVFIVTSWNWLSHSKKFQATDDNHCVYLTQYCFEGFCQLNSSLSTMLALNKCSGTVYLQDILFITLNLELFPLVAMWGYMPSPVLDAANS